MNATEKAVAKVEKALKTLNRYYYETICEMPFTASARFLTARTGETYTAKEVSIWYHHHMDYLFK